MKSFVNGAKLEGKWLQGNRMGNAKLTFKPSTNAEVGPTNFSHSATTPVHKNLQTRRSCGGNLQETRELNGACREPMLEAKKMRYALAPTLPDLQFNVTL
jgi:hypothetical protein